MSRFSSHAGWSVLMLMLSGTGSTALAAVESVPSKAASAAANSTVEVDGSNNGADAFVAPTQQARKSRGSVLRCWQSGRLIYEARDVAAGSRLAGAFEFRMESGAIQVLDLRQGLCVITAGGRP